MRVLSCEELFARSAPRNITFEIYKNDLGSTCIAFDELLLNKAKSFSICLDKPYRIELSDVDSHQMLKHALAEVDVNNYTYTNVMLAGIAKEQFILKCIRGDYTAIQVRDSDEFFDLIYLLHEGKYVIAIAEEKQLGITVKEFIETMESRQRMAIRQNNEIVWMGKVEGCVVDDSILNAVVKGLEFTTSAFCTYKGGDAQCWSGLIITI